MNKSMQRPPLPPKWSTGSPPTSSRIAHSSNVQFRVALRVICTAAVLLLSVASSSASPIPGDDECPGSVVPIVSESRPIRVTDGGPRRPIAMISPLPLLWFSDVRDATRRRQTVTRTTTSLPKPTTIRSRTNRSKNRKRKNKTKNEGNRNGKRKNIVLKNKIIVRYNSTPKTNDSPLPPPTTTVRVQETVPRCAANSRFSDVLIETLKSLEFQLAVSVFFALMLMVVMAIYRCWTSWTKRLTPFHVFP